MHSGTTMLIKILKRHSYVYSVDRELRLFESYPKFDHNHKGNKKYLATISDRLFLKDSDRDTIFANEGRLLNDTSTVGELTTGVIELLREKNNRSLWAEKTPSNVFFIDEILRRFPDSRIILIHRDIRSIIASKKIRTLGLDSGRYDSQKLELKRLEKDWNVIADSFSWRGAVKAQHRALKKHPDKVLVIKYEQFVKDPAAGWKRICNFLDIPYESECLHIKFRNAALKTDQPTSGVVASQTDWSTVLAPHEIELANSLNARSLQSLGYSVDVSGSFLSLFVAFCREVPGVFRRLLKRYKMFSLGYFYIYCKSMLRRI